MDRYLFLDINGVLKTEQHRSFLIANQQNLEDEYGELFDPLTIIQLERIVKETNPKIVISSSTEDVVLIISMVCGGLEIFLLEYTQSPHKYYLPIILIEKTA